MEGSKKLSDFFIQHKLSRFEKDAVPILVNANDEVIWIVGMRLDNRFKVTENTKKVLTLVYK
jgi:tRNA(Ile)-lysidine synthase